jgi:hypothetical protein
MRYTRRNCVLHSTYISNCVAPEGEGRFGVLWGMISKIDFFDAVIMKLTAVVAVFLSRCCELKLICMWMSGVRVGVAHALLMIRFIYMR